MVLLSNSTEYVEIACYPCIIWLNTATVALICYSVFSDVNTPCGLQIRAPF